MPDEEKVDGRGFFWRRFAEKSARESTFDEVWRDEAHCSNRLSCLPGGGLSPPFFAMATEQDDISIVDASSRPWRHDGEGYPGLEDLEADPDRLPESDGMAEDPPEPSDRAEAGGDDPSPRPGRRKWDGIGTHLEELRSRLAISLAVFVPLFGIGLWQYRFLWEIVILPLRRAAPQLMRFQALTPSDGLIMAMRIAFAFALFLSLPAWLSQALAFVSPGLSAREKKHLYCALAGGGGLFLLGAGIAYFAGIPFALGFLLPFNQSLPGWENAFTGAGYVDFVITSCAGFGLAFELPLLMAALGWIGILTPEGLREWRRPAILVIFILSAVLTPPDPFTQMLLALPMLFLFFAGCRLVRWTARERKE